MFNERERRAILKAQKIMEEKASVYGDFFANPDDVKKMLSFRLANKEHEVFVAVFLTAQHQMIQMSELFRGTIDTASVYPREVVKEALACNAAAVVFAHNHPSGNPEPSEADKRITNRLKDALSMVDIRTLDHIVVGASTCVSFAERGYL